MWLEWHVVKGPNRHFSLKGDRISGSVFASARVLGYSPLLMNSGSGKIRSFEMGLIGWLEPLILSAFQRGRAYLSAIRVWL